MRLGLTFGGTLLAALLIAPGAGLAQDIDDTSSGTTSLVIIEQISPEQQTTIDLGDEGVSQGDITAFTGSLIDVEGAESGKSSGFCIVTDAEAKLSECVWTYHFAEGTITVAGTEPDLGADTAIQMPIVGGTGDYMGARGVIHEQHNADQTVFTTTIEIIDASLLTASVDDYWVAVEKWDELTEEEQGAWNVLGWDETIWAGDDPAAIPVSETTPWAELTTEEQEAAAALGYDEASWADMQARVPEGEVDEFWVAQEWADLKYSEMRLWGLLGWDEVIWAGDDPAAIPVSETTLWEELTTEEQEAAAALGYDEASWADMQAREPEGEVDEFWAEFAWEDLKYSEMRLWGLLGWDGASWDGTTDEPESATQPWAELTAEQQDAAAALGYDEASWDALLP